MATAKGHDKSVDRRKRKREATNKRRKLQSPKNEDKEDDSIYEVERILAHRRVKSKYHYKIKWQNYPSEQVTWEPEEHIEAQDLLDEYWTSRRKQTKKPAKKGPGKSSKRKPRPQDPEGKVVDIDGEVPRSSARSWEMLIKEIVDITPDDTDAKSVGLLWKDGTRTSHPTEVVYQKCPQAMLQFYERHLRFRMKTPDQATKEMEPTPDVPMTHKVDTSIEPSAEDDPAKVQLESPVGPGPDLVEQPVETVSNDTSTDEAGREEGEVEQEDEEMRME
ncbi:hypothetical protein HKX48_000742 [Thoreauomyces humboldtii]|nr:hypothetical protein HKX48_000742 [Thoreauomyces humboldtii]